MQACATRYLHVVLECGPHALRMFYPFSASRSLRPVSALFGLPAIFSRSPMRWASNERPSGQTSSVEHRESPESHLQLLENLQTSEQGEGNPRYFVRLSATTALCSAQRLVVVSAGWYTVVANKDTPTALRYPLLFGVFGHIARGYF